MRRKNVLRYMRVFSRTTTTKHTHNEQFPKIDRDTMAQLFRPECTDHFYVGVISDDAHASDIKRVIASRIVIYTNDNHHHVAAADRITRASMQQEINNLNNEKHFSNAPHAV